MARVCALGSEKMQERLAWSEDLTPVVVPLARFADALTRNGSLGLRDFILDQVEERGGRTLRGAIAHRLDRGRVLLMLDGVDEPLTESRASVVKAIDRFRVDNCDNRVLVTSRPFGYARLGGDLAHCELPNFSRRQVRAFVEHWHTAFEHWQHPTAANDDRAQAEAKEMLREINRDERIAELAANPLMLVIISLIRREGGRLPEKRVELYNRAVNTLMDTWNRWRTEGAANVGGSHLPIDRLVSVWGRIAEWTRRTKSTGVIHRAELKTKLVEVLIEKELDDEDPENTAESYLNAAANKAGLLEERGKDIFAFWHPTFEEFLAAVELATPTARAVARITPLRYDPRWREVVLLAIGYVGTIQRDAETATAIVEAIVDSEPEPIEFLTHPALRLAVACVQDDIGVRRSFADRLIRELAGFIRITPYYPLMQVLHDVVEANPLFRPSPSTVKALLPVATDENWWARRDVARLCSNISGTNPSAKQFCRNLLSDWDADIMAAGALGLLRGGDYDPDLWLSLFGHTGFEIPETVEPGLSDFGKSIPDDALESLRTLLAASEFGHYQRAAEILSIVGRSSRKVIDALQSWLAAKQPRLQLQSASVLVKLGYASDSVSHTLRSLLDVDDPSVRLDAAFLLLDLEEAEDQVAQCALSLLETDDPDQLDGAFYILDETGHVDDGVLEALLSRLESKKLAVRKVAARPLLESGYRDQQLLDVLRSWLDDPDLNGRAFAANSLVQKGHVDEAVIQTLHVLVACEEYGLPMNAAEKLVNLGRADEKELDMLVSSFADRRSAYPDNSGQQLRQQLIDLVHLDRLMESLRRMIATGSERDRAVKLLIRLCNSHPTFQTFQQELRARLEQENPNTRIGILEALSELRPDEDAVEVLRELLAEEDYKVSGYPLYSSWRTGAWQ